MDRTEIQVSIVIPVYNEEGAIGDDLDTIIATMKRSGYTYELIVVDDGSTDRTADIARAKGVKMIQHPINRGTGAARRTGILQARGEIIVMTDGDGTYPNQDIPHLLEYLPAFDQVVGARTSEQGSFRFLRAPTKWFIRKLACYLTGMDIPDLNSGLRAFKREVMLKFLYLIPDGFSCVSTMTLAFLCNGYTIKYVPIDYYKRIGRSKFHPINDTYNYVLTVIRMVMYFNPLKVFLPSSFVLFLLGAAKTIYDNFVNLRIRESDVIMIVVSIVIGMMGLLADLIVVQHKRP
ncbi:MAG: glycosyltransferase family 2 protein [Anaerolineales bacterium]|nr:MAG: glycosyltransferase family 2 protein [Anaerolineales bacterium]